MIKRNPIILVPIIFLITGVVFFTAGVCIFIWQESFKQNAEQTTATITDIVRSPGSGDDSGSYDVFVTYTVGGRTYDNKLNYYTSSMRVGQEVEIYYNPDDPMQIMGTGIILPLIFGGLGGFFIVFGATFCIVLGAKRGRNKKLLQTGERIYAEISGVERNYSIRVNGVPAYYIACRWTDPSRGIIYLFRSKNIWYDPQSILEERNITTLPVYIDMQKPKNYYMDVSCVEDKVKDFR